MAVRRVKLIRPVIYRGRQYVAGEPIDADEGTVSIWETNELIAKDEESKTEEPKAEEPKTEEPKTEEPKTEEPKDEKASPKLGRTSKK